MFKKKDETKDYIFNAYKVEIFPTEKQVTQINKTFGCSRFVYNYFLASRRDTYKILGESMSMNECNNKCNELKTYKEFSFLKEVDKFALTNSLIGLDNAYSKFFEGVKSKSKVGYPKFKSKKNPCKSYTTNFTNGNIKVDVENGLIQLPKLGKVKFVQTRYLSRMVGNIKRATISLTATGRYLVSLVTELIVDKKEAVILTPEEIMKMDAVGVDLGIKTLAVLSDGTVIENPKWYRHALKRLRTMQKKISRMQRGSKNYEKQRVKIAKLHEYVANCRKDLMHKVTTEIVDKNQIICLEDLIVKGMVKNRRLAKSIQDVSFGMFKTFVKYKAKKKDKIVVFVDRFYASSKTCSVCDGKHHLLTLNDRQWVCPHCKTLHDRDGNASINIKNEGLRMLCS